MGGGVENFVLYCPGQYRTCMKYSKTQINITLINHYIPNIQFNKVRINKTEYAEKIYLYW